MAKFFKTFAKGILYILALPLLVVFLAVYFVISLFSFIFLSIQGIILFFKGDSLVGELEEDRLARERLDALSGNFKTNEQEINTAPTIQQEPAINQTLPQTPVTNNSINPVAINNQEQEVSVLLNDIDNNNIQNEEEIFEPMIEPEPEPEQEIEMEEYEHLEIHHDHKYDREEYIIDEPIKKQEKDSVNFFDYNGEENE